MEVIQSTASHDPSLSSLCRPPHRPRPRSRPPRPPQAEAEAGAEPVQGPGLRLPRDVALPDTGPL